jgi:hypothetical protein
MNRKFLMVSHTIIAAFIMPITLMFLITGSLYTWGIKGETIQATYTFTIDEASAPKTDAELLSTLINHLVTNKMPIPSGEPSFRPGKTRSSISWSGSNAEISFSVSENLEAKLDLRESTFYRRFVQLHKGKGGEGFKYYAMVLASGLLLLLFSGYGMALQLKQYRKLAIYTTIFGFAFFVLMVFLN